MFTYLTTPKIGTESARRYPPSTQQPRGALQLNYETLREKAMMEPTERLTAADAKPYYSALPQSYRRFKSPEELMRMANRLDRDIYEYERRGGLRRTLQQQQEDSMTAAYIDVNADYATPDAQAMQAIERRIRNLPVSVDVKDAIRSRAFASILTKPKGASKKSEADQIIETLVGLSGVANTAIPPGAAAYGHGLDDKGLYGFEDVGDSESEMFPDDTFPGTATDAREQTESATRRSSTRRSPEQLPRMPRVRGRVSAQDRLRQRLRRRPGQQMMGAEDDFETEYRIPEHDAYPDPDWYQSGW